MNKKAQIEIIGAGIVLLIVLVGGIFLLKVDDAHQIIQNGDIKFVGNIETGSFCSIYSDYSIIPLNGRIFFIEYEDAVKYNFHYTERCS